MENISLKSAFGIMTLTSVKGVGPATITKLLSKYDSLGQILNSHPDEMKGLATEPVRKTLTEGGPDLQMAVQKAYEEMHAAEEMGAVVLSVFDPGYPRRLATAEDRPLILYTSGDLQLLERSVACVGTRSPTPFGAAVSERMTAMLAEAGWTIVSGLARGVDAISHNVALDFGAPTAAVIGSGIDTYSSDAAFDLVNRINDSGGLILSEQPLGKEADPSSLIRRNRIITGCSAATFFMQAEQDCSTMHAVRYGLLQNRPIYAPGIPERFASEPINQTAINMSRMEAEQFGRLIDAKESIMQAIESLTRANVAIEVSGRDQYPEILSQLDALLTNHAQPSPSTTM